jgi:hypothetical protein
MTIIIPIHGERRIVIDLSTEEYQSLPIPCEPENWQPSENRPEEIRAALERALRQITG